MEDPIEKMYVPKDEKAKAKFVLHCDVCGFHKVTDGTDVKLVEIPQSQIQQRIPQSHKDDGGLMKRPKKFKCPRCGRGVTARKFNVPKVEEKKEETKNEENKPSRRKTSFTRREIPEDFTS